MTSGSFDIEAGDTVSLPLGRLTFKGLTMLSVGEDVDRPMVGSRKTVGQFPAKLNSHLRVDPAVHSWAATHGK